ncbi:hypothetical protein [Paenibacillus xylanivorans]|uniref:Uncharacterized protein n=1 Tax=Paenibacillus xylanivorans TaxID=1705561 RepID=A0A0N0C5V5_9BACL|nr:hypothetical protein [Paenibacillus xylanivorans]KOY17831.1 hypothetical protein AMS66_03595 [Paenibacillus xylanivorans]
MKKIQIIFGIAIALFAIVLISSGFTGNKNNNTYKFNIKSNDELLEQFKSNSLTVENNKKFGKEKQSQLVLDVELQKDEEISPEMTFYNGNISGKLKLKEEKQFFNFTGKDVFREVKYDDRTVYIGSVSVQLKNKINEEEAVLSIRFEPETKKIDVALTSGAIGETAFIPFGEAFLTKNDWDQINEIIYGESQQ